MKRIVALLLTLVLGLCLMSCGGGSKEPDTPEAAPAAEETPENTLYAEDLFTLEQMGYNQVAKYMCNIDFKFRNNTDLYLDRMSFVVQVLDENGDMLDDTFMGSTDIEPGQAVWVTFQDNNCTSSRSIAELAEKISFLKIIEVQIESQQLPEEYWTGSLPYTDIKYAEPIIFAVADIPSREAGVIAEQAENTADSASETADILTSHTWTRIDESSGLVGIITFDTDGTGRIELSDGEQYDLLWNAVSKEQIDTTLIVDGREAFGTYKLLIENGDFALQLTSDAKFTYYPD